MLVTLVLDLLQIRYFYVINFFLQELVSIIITLEFGIILSSGILLIILVIDIQMIDSMVTVIECLV